MNETKKSTQRQLSSSEIRTALMLPNGAETLYHQTDPLDTVPSVFELIDKEESVQAMAYLCRAAKAKQPRDKINALFNKSNREKLKIAINSNDPKLRKNAARLIGALCIPNDAHMLSDALFNESTLFVIPSMILSLGALSEKSSCARDAILNYQAPEASSDQARLVRDINEALTAARQKFIKREAHPFVSLDREYTIELCHPDSLGAALIYELNSMKKVKLISRSSSHITVQTDDLNALFNMRSFQEALFPVKAPDGGYTWTSIDYPAMAKAAHSMLTDLLRCHSGTPPYVYRIDTRVKDVDRREVARAMSMHLDADGIFENAATGYEFEIRIKSEGPHYALYIKLFTVADTRFSYRHLDVPASINPATAAALLGSVRDLKNYAPGARVLDICCGSGTLLIERERLYGAGKPSVSVGLDISRKALDAARKNAHAANSKAQFVLTDCLEYTVKPQERYHEVISNLPFGNRVGNHTNNRTLYEGIIQKLPDWLLPGGTALLYTADKKLLYKIIQKHSSKLQLLKEIKTASGGLSPSCFVLKSNR